MHISQPLTQMFLQDKIVLTANTTSQANSIAQSLMHQFVQSTGVPSGNLLKKNTKINPGANRT
jgi:hypothetical protein